MTMQRINQNNGRLQRALSVSLSILAIGMFSFAISLGDSPEPDSSERKDILLNCCEADIGDLQFSGGPPNERTGAPGEQTCVDFCHSTNALNTPGGTLTLSGPASYNPGDTINIAIDRERVGQKRWGFEITVLDGSNNPVGELLLVDNVRTQKSTALNNREYIKHTSSGTDFGVADVAPGWAVLWVAPSVGAGTVTFYSASNAANFDGSTSGDYIRTQNFSVSDATAPACCDIAGDADNSGSVTIGDVTFLIGYIFSGGSSPICCEKGDADGSGSITIGDVTHLIGFIFSGGAAPICGQDGLNCGTS
ncbi:hypothetical protein JYT16_01535 [Gemmatimonas aurantiaca]|nr:hypothetical protein [Gemmatimonas aurantiaca]